MVWHACLPTTNDEHHFTGFCQQRETVLATKSSRGYTTQNGKKRWAGAEGKKRRIASCYTDASGRHAAAATGQVLAVVKIET